MKKKLVLVVAMILVAITACACLAGCVPNRPDKFIGAWLTSEHKGMSYEALGVETRMGIDGGKMEVKIGDTIHVIFEEKGTEFNMYSYTTLTGWVAVSISKEEAEKNNYYEQLQDALNSEEAKEIMEKEMEAFDKNFEKKDGWWTAKAANELGVVIAYKIEGNTMISKVGDKESGSKMILNYKISIPKEAKEALKK